MSIESDPTRSWACSLFGCASLIVISLFLIFLMGQNRRAQSNKVLVTAPVTTVVAPVATSVNTVARFRVDVINQDKLFFNKTNALQSFFNNNPGYEIVSVFEGKHGSLYIVSKVN
jgi:hypothetical protein